MTHEDVLNQMLAHQCPSGVDSDTGVYKFLFEFCCDGLMEINARMTSDAGVFPITFEIESSTFYTNQQASDLNLI